MSVFIDKEKCKGCGLCVSICPVQAISIKDNKAFIDRKKCNDCLLCMDECPENAILQSPEKEVYLTKREHPVPYSLKQISPPTRQSFSSIKRDRQAEKREPMLINKLIRALDSFFEFESSSGISRKKRKTKHRRQKGRHRRGRF
jgi:Fe-S-cluster-containing hydrogenase component 2